MAKWEKCYNIFNPNMTFVDFERYICDGQYQFYDRKKRKYIEPNKDNEYEFEDLRGLIFTVEASVLIPYCMRNEQGNKVDTLAYLRYAYPLSATDVLYPKK